MKKIFLITALFALIAATSESQVTNMKSVLGNTVDTVTNGATKNLTSGAINGYHTIVTVQIIAVEISGTTGGTVTLQGSLDGTNYFALSDSVYTLTDVATQTASWEISGLGVIYLRVKFTGAGTMSDKVYAKYLARDAP